VSNLKLLSLFSGIGAFEKAMSNLGVKYDLVNYCEIDKHASKAYSLLHNVDEEFNLGDIINIDISKLRKFNIMTWGFPCTDISVQNQNGKGLNGEHSGLYYNGLRILATHKPKYSIIENVANLEVKDGGKILKQILSDLDLMGYNTYWKVLNSLDFNIPQNRKRIFLVSIRKDIDKKQFKFPIGKRTTTVFADLVDKESGNRNLKESLRPYLDQKYHVNYKSVDGLIKVFDGNAQGYFNSNFSGKRLYSIYGTCPTLTTNSSDTNFLEIEGEPNAKERLRLQGFDDADYLKLKGKITESQIKKQAGNSITVNVIQGIIHDLLMAQGLLSQRENTASA
jgi:DNA (cytosine-5)-methyltransferase 1